MIKTDGTNQLKQGYKNLYVWQLADELVVTTYKLTRNFPKDEVYGLTSQLRRLVLSVAANIIEGYARNSKNEFRHFLSISLGSLAETKYYLELSGKLDYAPQENLEELSKAAEKCGAIIWKLYSSQC